ncbi:MAG: hypothetical protein AABX30_02865, partial [Nanoarchaeota archaeon]
MRSKFIIWICILIIFPNIVSAFLISDQGTNVKEVATGNLTALANLTISMYDNSTGGTLIFEQNFSNTIANGSWNVMIDPNIQYGKSYWKDYKINGEDLDFDGNERLEFQSSAGKINNISFINFSLINSCSEGSSIRLVYENGSILCETDDSSSVNLTDYALKNQSETFTGNITTSQTGFFGWLGSLTNIITKIFVQDIDVSRNLNISGNITLNGTILKDWREINTSAIGWTNYVNTTAGAYTLLVNGTMKSYVDAQISGVSGGNATWNQSWADTLYSSIIWNYNQTIISNAYADLLNTSVTNRFTVYNVSAKDWTNYVNTTAGAYTLLVNG